MILRPPLIISARLLPAVKVGVDTLSIESAGRDGFGRAVYRAHLDLADGTEHLIEALRGGVRQPVNVRAMLASLCNFLSAAAESRHYREFVRKSDTVDRDSNETLFVSAVVDWASEHADEIGALAYEIENPEEVQS